MSKEAVVKFFQTLDRDEALSQWITSIEDPAEVARIAESELGLSITVKELSSAIAAMQKSDDASPELELSDEQLEAVAGGFFENWIINTQKVDFKVKDINGGW